MKSGATTRRRIDTERRNFTLRKTTTGRLDRLPREVNRSELVDEAIREKLASIGRAQLRKKLEEGYAARSADGLRMADEWFGVEEEAWGIASRAKARR